ncbi:MAG: hypothetical protein ACI883_000981 [Candidatus Azotimanducaceae bacterium]|jgi:hypothetical protein|tara:strand:- start:163 stop:1008 length:846 start_codon:yes stop_codon:yes gene_type:complete
MTKTLVLQSAPAQRPQWLDTCLVSVESWAAETGYAYRFIGDELFDEVPDWYMHKVAGRMPIASDLGRLLWIKNLLDQGEADTVVWLDADVLVFAPSLLRVEPVSSCLFGQELWIQKNLSKGSAKSGEKPQRQKGKWQARKNVHNALAAFRKGCPVLPFLIEVIQRMMRRVDANFIAPQMMGPKLLTNLHNLADFELMPSVGALSPEVILDLAGHEESTGKNLQGARQGALQALLAKQTEPMLAANLCTSLLGELSADAQEQEDLMLAAIAALNAHPRGLAF